MRNPPPEIMRELFSSPDLYFWKLIETQAHFARMSRKHFNQTIFSDNRLNARSKHTVAVDLSTLLEAIQKSPIDPPRLSYIFHVAHCGSTLLARALDLPSKNLVHREPAVLRQLSVLAIQNNWRDAPPDAFQHLLRLTLAMLGKCYVKDSPIIVKANVPVNYLQKNLLSENPNSQGLLLYSSFENYALTLLRTEKHQTWAKNIVRMYKQLISSKTGLTESELDSLTPVQNIACLWAIQLSMFNECASEHESVRTLDSEQFFSDPKSVLVESFKFFEQDIDLDVIEQIINSSLFSHHAKSTSRQYSNATRIEERDELRRTFAAQLADSLEWLLPIAEKLKIPNKLAKPLLGESPELIHAGNIELPSKKRISLLTDPGNSSSFLCIYKENTGQSLNDVSDELIIDGFKKYGVVLFKGFDYDKDSFAHFTQRFCERSAINPGRNREMIDEEYNIQTVNLGEVAFPLHPELSRKPWRPDVCFFNCESAPGEGGETTICDGVKVVESLDSATLNSLQSQPLRYDSLLTSEEAQNWLGTSNPGIELLNNPPKTCPFQLGIVDGKIIKSYITPALRKTMFSDELAFNNFTLFARFQNKSYVYPSFADGTQLSDELLNKIKTISDSLTLAIRWEVGDLIMLDNTRYLHGRNRILDKAERRIMTHFGYLKFAEIPIEETEMPWRTGDSAFF
ncbi:MAG: hypothetical protein GKR91_19535 [Pseudomonadales bacterium]|nr:hypothetical protein [Pseudomonadales bacterium]